MAPLQKEASGAVQQQSPGRGRLWPRCRPGGWGRLGAPGHCAGLTWGRAPPTVAICSPERAPAPGVVRPPWQGLLVCSPHTPGGVQALGQVLF